MPRYEVRWEFDVEDAASPREAAEKAWEAMRGPGSIADHFTVQSEAGEIDTVNLCESYGDAGRPQDLADLVPELVKALEGLLADPQPWDYHLARVALGKAQRAKEVMR